MNRLISISNFASGDIVPAYSEVQIDKMLAGDFSDSIPTYIDTRTGKPVDSDEARRRLATAGSTRPAFASADTKKVETALRAHAQAQALMSASASTQRRGPGFTPAEVTASMAKFNSIGRTR